MNKTIFPKNECHVPKWFVVDANGKTLGKLATEVSKLLRGKENSFFTPGVDQGNFVIVLNAEKIIVTGNKENQKLYYRNSQRPGSLKIETFKQLKARIPQGVLGRNYYRRCYVYSGENVLENKNTPIDLKNSDKWIKVEV